MPTGIILNSTCVLVGGLLGSRFGRYMPEKMRQSLSLLFGFCSMVIGISLLGSMSFLPAVTLALIAGTVVGEGLRLEDHISAASGTLKTFIGKYTGQDDGHDPEYIPRFVSLLMLFCTGSTGILGALGEGMTGDRTVLLTKSVMDLFASFSFAASMGVIVAAIAVVQLSLFLLLFLAAGLVMPYLNPSMIGDFMACGGVLAIITGFRICEIKQFRVTNALPALILIMPISWLWAGLF